MKSDTTSLHTIPDEVTRGVIDNLHVADLPYAGAALLARMDTTELNKMVSRLEFEVRDELVHSLALHDSEHMQEVLTDVQHEKTVTSTTPG